MDNSLIKGVQPTAEGEVYTRDLGRLVSAENLTQIISSRMNYMGANPIKLGKDFAAELEHEHRTIQGSTINFLVSALISMSEFASDARNEQAVAICKEIHKLFEDDKVTFQPFI